MRVRSWGPPAAAAAAACLGVFGVGGAPRWVQAGCALLLAIGVVPLLFSRGALHRVSPLVLFLAIAAGVTAFQLIPFPTPVVETLTPTTSSLREDGLALVGLPSQSTLTSDVPATTRALIFFASLLALSWILIPVATSERGRYGILVAVASLCGLAAVVTGVHAVLGAESLYGVYHPHATPSILGPLVNENHLGALMAVGSLVAIGLALYPRQRSWLRTMWILDVMACASACVATQSRGAVLALTVGALVCIGIVCAQRLIPRTQGETRRGRFFRRSLPIATVAGCAILLVVYSSAGRLEHDINRTSLRELDAPMSKYAAWRSATRLIEESPWLGNGRGAMESSLPRVHPASGFVTFSHLENEYLQAIVDWGFLGAGALTVVLLWFGITAARRWRDGTLAAAAIGVLIAIAVQSCVDFGIELLGLAIPVTAVAATLAYVPRKLGSAHSLRVGRIARGSLAVLLLAGAALLLRSETKSLDEDHRELSRNESTEMTAILESIARHPLDYYGYALLAEQGLASGEPDAIRLLNQAMILHPTHPGLHRMAATVLYRGNHRDQATIEFAQALRYSSAPAKLLAEIVRAFPPDQAVEAIPADFPDPALIIKNLDSLGKWQLAVSWLLRLRTLHHDDDVGCDRLYDLVIHHDDIASATKLAASCSNFEPDRATRIALARLFLKNARFRDVYTVLADVENWTGRLDEVMTAWLIRCDALVGEHELIEAKRCLRHLDVSGRVRSERRPEIEARLQQIDNELRQSRQQ